MSHMPSKVTIHFLVFLLPTQSLASATDLFSPTAAGSDKIAYPMLHCKAPFLLWHGFVSSHFQSFLVFTFVSFHLRDICYYYHSKDGIASRLSCFLLAYPSQFLRPKALFEHIILSRLLFFLESYSILSSHQAGFYPGRSTLDHIVLLSPSIFNGLNKTQTGFLDDPCCD